tara:strand:- start:69497 stop:69889 length:393 start_codon:yes stop_codon:yes gene_type:complete
MQDYFKYAIRHSNIELAEYILRECKKKTETSPFNYSLSRIKSHDLIILLNEINKTDTPYLYKYYDNMVEQMVHSFWRRRKPNQLIDSLNKLSKEKRSNKIQDLLERNYNDIMTPVVQSFLRSDLIDQILK